MKRIFETMFMALRASVTTIWNKVRLFFSPAFWQTKVIAKVRQFFSQLFNVKPRDKKDYYPVFRWLVSKRLAYAIVVALCVGCILILSAIVPEMISGRSSDAMPTYKYNAAMLKFYNGKARVTAHDGHIAYVGDVDDGIAEGTGALYDKDGKLVYEGSFGGSKYNGTGTEYYPGAGIRYTGNFVDNLYDGTGKYYRPSGVLEYEGTYSRGIRMGEGKLYNSSGSLIFTGNFRDDGIVYDELLGKSMEDAAVIYSGDQVLYMTDTESCISMPEIGAVCGLKDGSDSIEPEWSVDSVIIPSGTITLDGIKCDTVEKVAARLGVVEYEGSTAVLLPEAVVINQLKDDAAIRFESIDIETEQEFEEVLNVTSYDRNYQIYIHTFVRDGLLYTFYTGHENESKFDFYSISRAS